MSKFTITIGCDTPAELAGFVAYLNSNGSGIGITAAVPASAPAIADDEEDHTPAPPANFQPGVVDATGLPWDERIHSATHAVTEKNIWRRRRGVDPSIVAAVEAQLRANLTIVPPAAPAVVAAPVAAAPAPAIPAFPPPEAAPAVSVIPPMPSPVTAPAAPATPAAVPGAGTDHSFGVFMATASALMKSGTIDTAYLQQFAANLGVPSVAQLMNDPVKLEMAWNTLILEGKVAA